MAHYLVRARLKPDARADLLALLRRDAFLPLRPFGRALTRALWDARIEADESVIWEEEDYCSPPLAQERAAVLDACFDDITVEAVAEGEGWRHIGALPRLFPELAER